VTASEGQRESNVSDFAKVVFQLGEVKLESRDGWKLAGVQHPESESDHRFRAAIIGYALAVTEKADPGRTAMLCLLGQRPLSYNEKIGGLRPPPPPPGKVGRPSEIPRLATTGLVGMVRDFGIENRRGESVESKLAQDAELVECIVQAFEYEAFGHPLAKQWVESSYFGIKTPSGRKLASAVIEVASEDWEQSFESDPSHLS
jgi:putative hydrolase of HD superfamily